MTIIKDLFSAEAANMTDHCKSPESLEKTKDGSTFAAKARAAELNANRAQKAVANVLDNDLPTLIPVKPGSFKITRSRSRASNGGKSPNSLTEQPEVTANERLKSPSLQRRCYHVVT